MLSLRLYPGPRTATMKLSGKPWIMNEGRGSRPNPQRMLQASGPQHPDCSFYRGLLQAPAVVGRGDSVPCRGFTMVAVSPGIG
jgi:hypothetical protein